jgi:hypothetical protein
MNLNLWLTKGKRGLLRFIGMMIPPDPGENSDYNEKGPALPPGLSG